MPDLTGYAEQRDTPLEQSSEDNMVRMEIPTESLSNDLEVAKSGETPKDQTTSVTAENLSTMDNTSNQVQNGELPTGYIQEEVKEKLEEELNIQPILPQIERDEKGRIVKGIAQDTNKNGTAGRPCALCDKKDELLKATQEYIKSGLREDKPKVLFLNELALKLGYHAETITEWTKKTIGETNELEHPEFSDYIKTLLDQQELRLQQRIMGRFNPTGSMFLLKTKHGYIETEKKILAGGNQDDKPLEIKIVEDKKDVE